MKQKFTNLTLILILPVLFALIARYIFGGYSSGWKDLYSVMTLAFIFLIPMAMGALTIYFSPLDRVRSRIYRITMPWATVAFFMFVTMIFTIEGWICWLMALPLFLIAASLGGWIAGRSKLRKHKNEKLQVTFLALLPFLVAPAEQLLAKIPGRYKADTQIDIHASKENIWHNVTRVREIDNKDDKGWFTRSMGFPRPIKAELNYEGTGAYRKAIFDKGLVFDETVTAYQHQRMMSFTIKADPYDIPSTTMDEHIVIGGDYFDVLNGTYELEDLGNGTYRLHLYSHFKLTTSFNFYASWWAGWIMKDIQNNILQVIKTRAEHESAASGFSFIDGCLPQRQ